MNFYLNLYVYLFFLIYPLFYYGIEKSKNQNFYYQNHLNLCHIFVLKFHINFTLIIWNFFLIKIQLKFQHFFIYFIFLSRIIIYFHVKKFQINYSLIIVID